MVTRSSHASTGSSEEIFLPLRFPLRLDTSTFHMTRSSEHRSRSNVRSAENYWPIPTKAKRRSHVFWRYRVNPLSCACTMRNNEEFISICQPLKNYYVFLESGELSGERGTKRQLQLFLEKRKPLMTFRAMAKAVPRFRQFDLPEHWSAFAGSHWASESLCSLQWHCSPNQNAHAYHWRKDNSRPWLRWRIVGLPVSRF